MAKPCPDGQVLDKVTKACRAPLKRGRKSTKKSNKPCPDGQVLDKVTKACRAPLKRGRTAKRAQSPRAISPRAISPRAISLHGNQDNTTLDKFGFVVPKYKPKVYNEAKPLKQTTLLAFSKKANNA
jgi:hypothetical protein